MTQKRRTMIELTSDQVRAHCNQIEHYVDASNAADGSAIDPNANVEHKTVATLRADSHKSEDVQINRKLLQDQLVETFGNDSGRRLAKQYIRDIEDHYVYVHDESALITAYCAAISLHPLLESGTKSLGGPSEPPKHLGAYMGQLVNTIFNVSAQVAGAVGVPGALVHMDAYARADYGDDYMETHRDAIKQYLEFFLYTVNEPAGARGHQCFDETTELMTPSGFKKWSELSEGDEAYVWSEGKLETQPIQKMNVYDHSGEMHHYQGRDVDMLVTPNHRILYQANNKSTFHIAESSELFNAKSPLTVPICAEGGFQEQSDLKDDLIKLLIWVMCEGTFVKEHNKATRVRVFKSENRGGITPLAEISDRLGFEYSLSERTGSFDGCSPLQQLEFRGEARHIIVDIFNGSKKRLPKALKDLNSEQAKLAIDTWASLDGHVNSERYDAIKLQCDSEEIQSDIQILCQHAGLGSTTSSRLIGANKTPTLYVIPYQRQVKSASEKNAVPYSGKVWCPTTEAGIVIVRRNGKTFVSGNSCFTNISIFDQEYFEALFGTTYYPAIPDVKPCWESYSKLQEYALDVIREENRKAVLTFPVKTATILHDGETEKDPEFVDMIAEDLSQGSLMFLYLSDSVDSLSSCCRLKNSLVEDGKEFMHSLGAGGVATGSLNVITLNLNRIIQDHRNLKSIVERVIKYQVAHRRLFEKYRDRGLYPLYDAGYLDMDKQFLTIGINGIVEAAESLGIPVRPGGEYDEFVHRILKTLKDVNQSAKDEFKYKFNTEFVPAENLGVKNAKWDREDGYRVPRDCYNSYFFPMEDPKLTIVDKFKLHGGESVKLLDGGSALHLNLDETPSKEGYKALIRLAIRTGCEYFTTNVLRTCCEECQHVEFSKQTTCLKCGSENISYATRIIGYLKKIPAFSSDRQKEAGMRVYHRDVDSLVDGEVNEEQTNNEESTNE